MQVTIPLSGSSICSDLRTYYMFSSTFLIIAPLLLTMSTSPSTYHTRCGSKAFISGYYGTQPEHRVDRGHRLGNLLIGYPSQTIEMRPAVCSQEHSSQHSSGYLVHIHRLILTYYYIYIISPRQTAILRCQPRIYVGKAGRHIPVAFGNLFASFGNSCAQTDYRHRKAQKPTRFRSGRCRSDIGAYENTIYMVDIQHVPPIMAIQNGFVRHHC